MVEEIKVAVSGAKGFIGSKLCQALRNNGYGVMPLVRHEARDENEIFYDYNKKLIDHERLAKCWAVIHLAGKNIMSGIWTKKLKEEIYESRVKSTRFISHALSEMKDGPRVLLSASAIGIYGDRFDQKLDEDAKPGTGFLAHVCTDWERGTLFFQKSGGRVVNMRFGMVLDRSGGMLKSLHQIFSLGLGGPFGNGEQYISYLTLDELVSQILFVLRKDDIKGPVNMVSYEPTTNEEFTDALARILKRPKFLRLPKILLNLFGEQGKMVTASTRAYPKVLLDHGYQFVDDHDIESVLQRLYA